MLKYNYIILILFVSVVLNCTPTRYYREKNAGKTQTNYSSDNISQKNFHDYDNNDYQDFSFIVNDGKNFFQEYETNDNHFLNRAEFYTHDSQINYKYKYKDKINNYKDINQKKYIKTKQYKYKDRNPKNIKVSKYKTYKVKKGDNLLKISKKFGTSTDEIIDLNKIKNPDKIYSGMILKIPEKKIQKRVRPKSRTNNSNKAKNPHFCWPIKDIYSTKRDGLDGVKPIGIIITGKASTSVLSSADGIVTKVGHMRGFGNYIILKHINKYLTIYSNLKEIKVNEGDRIKKGKIMGKLDGNKLHFQIGYSGKPEDPLLYLSKKS